MAEVFKIKNRFITGLSRWLQMIPAKGQYSRSKSRFIKHCLDKRKEIGEFYQELLERLAEKDKAGKLRTTDRPTGRQVKNDKGELIDETQQVYVFKDLKTEEEFLKELEDLYQEDYIVEINEANKKDFKVVKDIVLNTDYEFGPKSNQSPVQQAEEIRLASEYDEWCIAFETLNIK